MNGTTILNGILEEKMQLDREINIFSSSTKLGIQNKKDKRKLTVANVSQLLHKRQIFLNIFQSRMVPIRDKIVSNHDEDCYYDKDDPDRTLAPKPPTTRNITPISYTATLYAIQSTKICSRKRNQNITNITNAPEIINFLCTSRSK